MTYDAVVFDKDGVLAEPTDWTVIHDAVRDLLRELVDGDPDEADVETLVGGGIDDIERLAGSLGVDPERLWHRRERAVSEAQRAAMRAGEKTPYDDVDVLRAIDGPVGVVSNNQHWTVEFFLSHFDLAGAVACYYGREPTLSGIERMKPDPHYLQGALSDLGLDPGRDSVLYVGDSESDVAAAAAAGIDSAFVRRPHRRDYALDRSPTHEVRSLDELPV